RGLGYARRGQRRRAPRGAAHTRGPGRRPGPGRAALAAGGARAAARAGGGAQAQGERLVRLVASQDPWIRAAALGALARSDRENFALVLSGMDPDRVFWVRSALAGALGKDGDEMSVGILHGMLRGEGAR